MRNRVNDMRKDFMKTFAEAGLNGYEHMGKQFGMFSMLPLSKDQIEQLKDKPHVYMVGSGRINVSALTESRIDKLADVIKNDLS